MINIFFYLGITVTKQMSGTARAVIAQVRKGENCSKRGGEHKWWFIRSEQSNITRLAVDRDIFKFWLLHKFVLPRLTLTLTKTMDIEESHRDKKLHISPHRWVLLLCGWHSCCLLGKICAGYRTSLSGQQWDLENYHKHQKHFFPLFSPLD